ncbi:MAG TPA: HPF/RaiA family ribosome-associated protein [Methylomirabilota bacterium]|jgi:cold shock CspA family protein|nr:HPF/RaiA family ribosome-associated protein [Methylomirabilota bacterium]
MNRPVEVTFRNVPHFEAIETVVRREAQKLERYSKKIVGCRVAIERPQRFQRQGNTYRVRISISAAARRPIVVSREPLDSDMHDDLRTIVIGAFKAARRQLQSMVEQQRGDEKPPHEPRALVVRLFPEAGYGFLKTPDGEELYFHRNSVLHDDFERLAVGTEVRFEEAEGEQGPQASTVQVVNKPGVRLPASGPSAVTPPRGWEDVGARRGRRRAKRGSAR